MSGYTCAVPASSTLACRPPTGEGEPSNPTRGRESGLQFFPTKEELLGPAGRADWRQSRDFLEESRFHWTLTSEVPDPSA